MLPFKNLRLSHFNINLNTGLIYPLCKDCGNKSTRIKKVKYDVIGELKNLFIDYGFEEELIFIATHPGDYYNVMKNIMQNKNEGFENINGCDVDLIDMPFICIFEINNICSAEKKQCINKLIDIHLMKMFKYLVLVNSRCGSSFHINIIGLYTCDISVFTCYMCAVKYDRPRICDICNNELYTFKKCYRCQNEYCSTCYYSSLNRGLMCVYCRDTFQNHYTYLGKSIDDCFIYG